MLETSYRSFQRSLHSQVDKCIANHDVLRVNRRNATDFVVMSSSDWESIQELVGLKQSSTSHNQESL